MTEPTGSGSSGSASPSRSPGAGSPSPGRSYATVARSASGGGFPLWAKVLLGCGVVALALGAVLCGLAFWGLQRLIRPAPPVEPQYVVGPEALGWVRVESMADDPGMREMAQSLLLTLQRVGHQQQRKELPEWLRGWADLSQAQQGRNPFLHWLLPHGMTLAFEPGLNEEGAEILHPLGVLNLGMIARIVGWVSGLDDTGEMVETRGYRVIEGKDHVLALRGGSIWIARDLASWERLLDRVEAGQASEDPRLTALSEGSWDLSFYLDNRRRHFEQAMTETFGGLGGASGEAAGTVDEAFFRADVVSAEILEAELVLEAVSEEAARVWERALEQHRTANEAELVRFELAQQIEGRRLRATWKLEGVAQWLGDRLMEALEEMEARAREQERQKTAESDPTLPPEAPESPESPEPPHP